MSQAYIDYLIKMEPVYDREILKDIRPSNTLWICGGSRHKKWLKQLALFKNRLRMQLARHEDARRLTKPDLKYEAHLDKRLKRWVKQHPKPVKMQPWTSWDGIEHTVDRFSHTFPTPTTDWTPKIVGEPCDPPVLPSGQ